MIEGVQVRLGESGDAVCISGLAMQVFLQTYATEGIRASLVYEMHDGLAVDKIRALLARSDTVFLLAEKAGHLLAFAQITIDGTPPSGVELKSAELNRLYVQERFTGYRIGRILLERAEQVALRKGASAMWLTAWMGNERALLFYPRMGYKEAGTTQFTFGKESYENQVFMKRLVAKA